MADLIDDERKQANLYGYFGGDQGEYRQSRKRTDKAIKKLEARAAEVATAYADRDAALERLGAVLAERDQLARLREVATERVVGYAAVIEQALATIGDVHEQWKPLVLVDILASADTDAALREVRATELEDAGVAILQWDHLFGPDAFEWLRGRASDIREGAKTDG